MFGIGEYLIEFESQVLLQFLINSFYCSIANWQISSLMGYSQITCFGSLQQ